MRGVPFTTCKIKMVRDENKIVPFDNWGEDHEMGLPSGKLKGVPPKASRAAAKSE